MKAFVRSLTLSAAIWTPLAASAQSEDADLQAAAQNPVAAVISVPFQNNTLFGIGPNDETVNVLNIQPVIPIELTDNINVITRTIIPLINIPGSVDGLDVLPQGITNDTKFGLGDINFSAYFSPAKPGKVIWGVGPSITLPTASDDALGSDQTSAGLAAVALTQPGNWTIGGLARQLWSVNGSDTRADVNQFLFQPFVNYNLEGGWYLVSAPVITNNWDAASGEGLTLPIGGGVGQLTRVGKRPVNWSVQSYYNIEKPALGPDWGLRLQVTLLYPQ